MSEQSTQKLEREGTAILAGLGTAGAFNAAFGRNKKDTWQVLGLLAVLVGFYYSLKAYIHSWKESGSYERADKWIVRAGPVAFYWAVFYTAGWFGMGYLNLFPKDLGGFINMGILLSIPMWYSLAGYALYRRLRSIHAKYGNTVLAFWRHLLCSISIGILSTLVIQAMATWAPSISPYTTEADVQKVREMNRASEMRRQERLCMQDTACKAAKQAKERAAYDEQQRQYNEAKRIRDEEAAAQREQERQVQIQRDREAAQAAEDARTKAMEEHAERQARADAERVQYQEFLRQQRLRMQAEEQQRRAANQRF